MGKLIFQHISEKPPSSWSRHSVESIQRAYFRSVFPNRLSWRPYIHERTRFSILTIQRLLSGAVYKRNPENRCCPP